MASVSTSSGGSGPLRRGQISSKHSFNCSADDARLLPDKDLPLAIYKRVVAFYEEAFDRLPSETMPDLLGLLTTGGFCLGLLDPVSSIILNTLTLLPIDGTATASSSSSPAAATDSSSSSPAAKRRRKSTEPSLGTNAWKDVATKSYQSLLCFLMTYFGCLTRVQAIRYLYRADANLPLAVMLVQHDLYYAEPLDPESDRTQAALKWAATTTGHPSPTTLTQLMSIRLKEGDFELLEKQFAGDGKGSPLTAEEVREIQRVVHTMMRPMCAVHIIHNKKGLNFHVCRNINVIWSQTPIPSTTAGSWMIDSTSFSWAGTPISSVQFGLPEKLQDCLRIADGQKHILKTPCGDACNYLNSLEMLLHGMIHNMYVKALKLLPTPSGSLMRSILMAGHCYGSCDPLSNIILNSIWYDVCSSSTPLPDRRKFAKYNDILDPVSLLRPVVRSLKGLVELALFADPQSSIACAMEKLCSAKCFVTERTAMNHLHEAARAARHPVPLKLGDLHRMLLLMPDARKVLLQLITQAQTGGCVLNVNEIMLILTTWSVEKSVATVQAPKLCEQALRVVSNKRSEYEKRRSWLRSKIEKVLQDYTDQHSYGPKYTLDIIFGVEKSNQARPPFFDMRYHINFLATSDPELQRTLFFAELWSSPKPEAEFCCPLPYAYAGRCYSDVYTARKIVYPDDAKYIPQDITEGGTGSVDDMLEMDLVYFSSQLDVKLAENLNMLPSSVPECEFE